MCKGLKHPAVAVKQTPCQTLLDQDEASHCPSVFMGHCVYKGKAKYHLSPRALRSGPLAPEGDCQRGNRTILADSITAGPDYWGAELLISNGDG